MADYELQEKSELNRSMLKDQNSNWEKKGLLKHFQPKLKTGGALIKK